jgi:hypothetical protein
MSDHDDLNTNRAVMEESLIEKEWRIWIEVMRKLDNLEPSECRAQEQSPLFGVIPAEIRDQIFSYCLAEQSGNEKITKEEYYYRPDYRHYQYIDTALLLTCRRIYLETRMIPVQNVTYRDYLGSRRRRPSRSECSLSSLFLIQASHDNKF